MMRYWPVAMLGCAALAAAQTEPTAPTPEMPSGFVRGAMAGWDGTATTGQLTVRAADGSLSTCGYDFRSWFERAHERIAVSKLVAGDSLEVLADRKPGLRACYVRIVHVLEPQPPSRPKRAAAVKLPDPPLPRGDRTLSGLVIRREGLALSIKTRDGERALVLRPDTAYFGDGIRLDAAALAVNTHVFVRAGRDEYGRIVAYQVMWGEIVDPTH
ncbi:MAG TPA: hypothetical protein VN841_13830 [Bryobacteraceae bacterium]|nr:hypothetical protein [Bryobacteraceae bacterium]